jgi:HK97 family phage portal protein
VIVRTFDGLQALTTPTMPRWSPSAGGSVNLYDYRHTYFEIYRTQPNVRICVDFLARNVADVAPQAFRRVSDTDRVRLADHDLITWLDHPNPATVRFRLVEDLITDLGIYYRAFLLKVRYVGADGRDAIGLVRLPPDETQALPEGALLPQYFRWTVNGRFRDFAPSEIVHFAGYKLGISPLETLRRILAEEHAAGEYREHFWRHGARVPGVVTRPATAKRYTQERADEWREGWRAAYGGAGGEDVVLLQEGETFQQTTQSAKDSEYTVGGKLRREICASVYQIPQPFVGILDHATFSNIREQHKNLYQDCLGPWFEWLRQEIHRQLLVECEDQAHVYLEFNIDKKLAGTPEERAASIYLSTGRPWRTVSEARALENLPHLDDPTLDEVAQQQGGPATNTAPAEPPAKGMTRTDGGDGTDSTDAITVTPILQAHRTRQTARLNKLPAAERPAAFFADFDRWNRELAADLTPLLGADQAARVAIQANVRTFDALETAA